MRAPYERSPLRRERFEIGDHVLLEDMIMATRTSHLLGGPQL